MSKKDEIIEAKIDEIDNISQSQIDRIRMKDELDENLYGFCKDKIDIAIKNNPLKEKILEKLDEKIDDDISVNSLVNILQELNRSDNGLTEAILKFATEKEKANTQILIQNNKTNPLEDLGKYKETNLTKQDVDDAKKAIDDFNDVLNLVKLNEFNENEK